jgi:thiol-disulfide isomerase/thioredoxin
MFKLLNTLLLLALLTACSSQDEKEGKENIQTDNRKIETHTKQIAIADTEIQRNISSTSKEIPDENGTDKIERSRFTLTTLAGETIHIDETEGGLKFKEYQEKAVLLLFFGHRCPPCLGEIPVLKALVEKGHKDLEIIAIEVQGYTEEQLKAFKKSKGINYHLVANSVNSNLIDYIAQQTQWRGAIPFLIGFNKQSVVKVVHAGGLNAADFDNIYNILTKGE